MKTGNCRCGNRIFFNNHCCLIATTATDVGGRALNMSPSADPEQLVSEVLNIVIEVSEYNFDLGLSALLPERLPPAVIEKLAYVHSLRSLSLERVALETQ